MSPSSKVEFGAPVEVGQTIAIATAAGGAGVVAGARVPVRELLRLPQSRAEGTKEEGPGCRGVVWRKEAVEGFKGREKALEEEDP